MKNPKTALKMIPDLPSISLSPDVIDILLRSVLDLGWYHLAEDQGNVIKEQYMKCHREHGTDLVIAPYIECNSNTRRLGIALRKQYNLKIQPELFMSILLHFGPNLEVIPQLLYPDKYGPPPIANDSPSSQSITLHLSDPEHFLAMQYFPFWEEPGAATDCSRLLSYIDEQFSKNFPAVSISHQWKLDPNLPADSPLNRLALYHSFYNCYVRAAHQVVDHIHALSNPIADNKSLVDYAVRCAAMMDSSLSAVYADIYRYSQGDAISAAVECYEEYLESSLAVTYRSYHSSLALLEHILHKPSTAVSDPTVAISFLICAATESYKAFTQQK